MQVSHVETANTHAILGGGEARAFSMSQTAEFFTVLSDTLYRDKKRAVIREVLCNAWDAHIVTDRTHIPVEIELSEESITIRDHGPGIADDVIVENYCTYGGSTKLKSEKETGGFGLGSKAPFAYSDHFSVTSRYKGQCSIYAISRGGVETKGIPDMRLMVQTPTEESGLSVTIPIKKSDDLREFREIIRTVTKQGGMRVKLNDQELSRYDFDEARKTGFMVVQRTPDMNESTVYVSYGAVLYPLSSTEEEVTTAVNRITSLVPVASGQGHRVILMAPPNSVGVTPSREALSYTDTTIATIKELADRLVRNVRPLISKAAKELVRKQVAGMEDFDRCDNLHYQTNHSYVNQADTALSVAKVVAAEKFFDPLTYQEVTKFIGPIMAEKFRQHRRSLRRAFLSPSRAQIKSTMSQVYLKPYIRAASDAGELRSLFAVGGNAVTYRSHRFTELCTHVEPEKTVIVAQSRTEAIIYAKDRGDELRQHDSWSEYLQDRAYICAAIPRRKSKQRAALIKAMEARGFKCVEIKEPVKKAAPAKPKGPKDSWIDLAKFNTSSGFQQERTLNDPEYFLNLDVTLHELRNSSWFHFNKDLLRELYPSCAVVRGEAQVKKAKKAGAKDAFADMAAKIRGAFKTRDGKLALLLAYHHLVQHQNPPTHYISGLNTATELLKEIPEVFFEFVPARPASRKRVLEHARRMKLLKSFMYHHGAPDSDKSLKSDMEIEQARAWHALGNEMLTRKQFAHHWEHLSSISSYGLSAATGDEKKAAIVRMVRAVKETTPLEDNV